MKRSSLSSENWRMKFEISVKIYSKKKEIFISKKNYSFVIRFLEFQSRFSIHFLQPAILSHYSNNFQSVGDPFLLSKRRESWCQYDPRISSFPFFFFFSLSFSPLYPITRFGTSLSFRFNRVAHRKKSNYLPFLLAFRQHRFPLFRDKEILSPIVPFIFTEDNLPFLIPLFIIASRFESFAQRKSQDQFIKLST